MSATCSVRDRCGPSGKECRADDRECQNAAVKEGLEILCEDRERDTYVYCPAGTQARDSSIVWWLLIVAVAIAALGGGAIFLAMKKGPKSEE
jgi:hypothetical protein